MSCPTPALCFLFVSCSRHHQALHSFPTRRSSDLRIDVDTEVETFVVRDLPESSFHVLRQIVEQNAANFDDLSQRSEEHTSELQSRENIVCRLLLEKKKIEYASVADGISLVIRSSM